MKSFQVEVSTLGRVYDGLNAERARMLFEAHRARSIAGKGDSAGADVSLLENGVPVREYLAPRASDGYAAP